MQDEKKTQLQKRGIPVLKKAIESLEQAKRFEDAAAKAARTVNGIFRRVLGGEKQRPRM